MTSNLNEFSIGTSATFYNLSRHQPGRHKKIKEKKIQISIYQKKGLTDPSKDNDLKSQISIYQKKGLTDPLKIMTSNLNEFYHLRHFYNLSGY